MRKHRQLGAACSSHSRVLRSSIGAVIGGVIGFGTAYVVSIATKPSVPLPPSGADAETIASMMSNHLTNMQNWAKLYTVVDWAAAVVAAGGGALIAGHKPSC